MRFGSTSITETGMETPSSVNMRVIPLLRPTIPIVILLTSIVYGAFTRYGRPFQSVTHSCHPMRQELNIYYLLTKTNLNLNTRSQIQLHQRIYRFFSWLNNIQQTLVCTNLILITRIFINVRRNQNGEALFTSRQRNRATNLGTCALCGLNNLLGRSVDEFMIESLQANPNALILHVNQTPIMY